MALEIFRLLGSVFVDTDAASKSLHKTDKDAERLSTSLATGFKKVGAFVAGVGAAAAAVGAGVVALTENTREYRTEQGKLQTAFETQNFSAQTARKTYEALNGVLGDSGQAVEAATHLAMLTNNEEELSTWTKICTGVFATFGDSLPIEGLTEAANETAKVGKVTGPLADALNWAGVSEDKLNESLEKCTSEQERQVLITNTLNGLYSEAADKYREVNGEVIAANKAQDKMSKTMADIGAALEPIVTKGKEFVAEALVKATPLITSLGEVAVPLLANAFDLLIDPLNWTVDLFTKMSIFIQAHPVLMGVLAIAVGTLTAAVVAYTVAQNAATIATTVVTAATTAWGVVMAFVTSPITLVVVAIGGLIAMIYILAKNWDAVGDAAVRCWEWIQSKWSEAGEWFQAKIVQPIANLFATMDGAIRQSFSKAMDGAKSTWSGAVVFFKSVRNGIESVFATIPQWFETKFRNAWQAVKNVFSTGGQIFVGITEGIANVFRVTVNAIIRGINNVIAVPFNNLNNILNRIRNTTVAGIKPFAGLASLAVPQIPQLYEGAVLERGQVGLLEGTGAEAVVPLERNQKWIRAVARDMRSGGIGGDQEVMQQLLDAFLDFAANLPLLLAANGGNQKIVINKREFARLVKAVE